MAKQIEHIVRNGIASLIEDDRLFFSRRVKRDPVEGLILAAHGAGEASEANQRVTDWAAEMQRLLPDVRVGVAFQLGRPRFEDALDPLGVTHATVVPLFTSEGYFVQQRLREGLHAASIRSGVSLRFTPPVGLSGRLRNAIANRAAAQVAALEGDVAVIVVGHGTLRNPNSGAATQELSRLIAHRAPRARVFHAYLDQPPSLEQVVRSIEATSVVVVPFFIGGGSHAERDIAERLSGVASRSRVIVAPPLGESADVVSGN